MIIYIPYGPENSEGFPSEYPRESRQLGDKEIAPDGWITVTEHEFKQLLQAHYATVEAATQIKEEATKTRASDRAQRARQRFAECEVIDADWTNATNPQKFALARNVYKILNSVQSEIIELISEKGNDS